MPCWQPTADHSQGKQGQQMRSLLWAESQMWSGSGRGCASLILCWAIALLTLETLLEVDPHIYWLLVAAPASAAQPSRRSQWPQHKEVYQISCCARRLRKW